MANEYISALSGAQMDTALMDMAQHTSEAWATGTRNGRDVESTDETYENNAKYYAEQAARVVPEAGEHVVRYDVAQVLTEEEQTQARSNINAVGGLDPVSTVTDEFISKISTGGILAKIKKLTGKSVVQNNAIVDTDIKGFGSTGKNQLNLITDWLKARGATYSVEGDNVTILMSGNLYSSPYKLFDTPTTVSLSCESVINSANVNGRIALLDENLTVINQINETRTTITANNAMYIRGDWGISETSTFKKLQIEVGTTATSYEPYNPYFRNFPIVLRSAGNVADEVEDTGNGYKVTRRVGTVDLGTLNWNYVSSGDSMRADISNAMSGTNNLLNPMFAYSAFNGINYRVYASGYTTASAFKTAVSGVYLNYELATPIVEYHSYNLTYPVTENGTEYFDSPIAVPCEIEYGIDALNDIVSGVVGGDTERDYEPIWGELLWENASPNSVFASQNLNIDFSKYSSLLIVWHTYAGATYPYISMICEKNITNEVCSNLGTNGVALGNIWVGKRDVYLGEAIKQIQFGNGNSLNNGGTWAQNNSNCIPFRIYGIK